MTDDPRPPVLSAGPAVVLVVGVGGAAGATLRSLVTTSAPPASLPVETLLVNVTGSLLLGVLAGWLGRRSARRWVRPFLGTGVLGGFTTYGTFATEVVTLGGLGPATVAAYVALTVLLAVGAAATGVVLGDSAARRAGGGVVP